MKVKDVKKGKDAKILGDKAIVGLKESFANEEISETYSTSSENALLAIREVELQKKAFKAKVAAENWALVRFCILNINITLSSSVYLILIEFL